MLRKSLLKKIRKVFKSIFSSWHWTPFGLLVAQSTILEISLWSTSQSVQFFTWIIWYRLQIWQLHSLLKHQIVLSFFPQPPVSLFPTPCDVFYEQSGVVPINSEVVRFIEDTSTVQVKTWTGCEEFQKDISRLGYWAKPKWDSMLRTLELKKSQLHLHTDEIRAVGNVLGKQISW